MRHQRPSSCRIDITPTIMAIMVVLWATPTVIFSQTMFGDFVGTVIDSSGGMVPDVLVTLTNQGTHATRIARTDESGAYRINGVMVGAYSLSVERSGFRKITQRDIYLQPSQEKRVDFSLEVGTPTESIEVKDTVPVLQSESGTLTGGLPQRMLIDAPVDAVVTGPYAYDPLVFAPGSAAGRAGYAPAGYRTGMESTSLDGVQFNQYHMQPPPTAYAEVNTVFSNAPAEYARPATFDATFRSGSNRFTGEWLESFENPCLDAWKTPFSQPTHVICNSLWRHFFTVGGPVYIPHVYDGRNKTFFFFTYSPQNLHRYVPRSDSVPTLAMQAGDFSKYPKAITDPLTGAAFPGNIIPQTRLSPVSKNVVSKYYGNAYPAYVGGPDNYVNNVLIPASLNVVIGHSYVLKFDQNLGTRDIFSFSFFDEKQSQNQQNGGIARSMRAGSGNAVNYKTWSLAFTHTFSPQVVSQLRLGASRDILVTNFLNNDLQAVLGEDVVKQLGLQINSPPNISGCPQFSIANWQNLTRGCAPNATWDTRYQLFENVSVQRGRHSLKFGFSAIRLLNNIVVSGPLFGAFTFDGTFTTEPWADFLLGLPGSFQKFTGRSPAYGRMWNDGAFAQDDFRVNSKLTLSYGLRWELYTAPYDKSGLYYNFDLRTSSVVVPDQQAVQTVSPGWPSKSFPVVTANSAGFPAKLIDRSNSFQPRLGFAYRLRKSAVLRGGYGVYNADLRFNALQSGGPFALTESYVNLKSSTSSTGSLFAFPTPFPPTLGATSVASLTGYSTNYRSPYAQNWNLTFEQQIATDWAVQFTYRGIKTTQLLWLENLNTVAASAQPFSASRRPFPNLSSLSYIANGANSWYDALVAQVSHPLAKGLYFTAAYTRSWSGTEQPGSVGEQDQTATAPEYAYNRARDGGRDPSLTIQDIVATFVADVPVRHDKKLRVENRLANAVVGNWIVSGAFSWRSGIFFTPVLSGIDPGNLGVTSNRRPSLVSGCDPYSSGRNLHGLWFNPACYTTPSLGQLGDAGVNSLVGPGAWVFNLNPYKEFPVTLFREGTKIVVGANIYNLLNHPVYNTPNAIVNSPTAGRITTTDSARGQSNIQGGQNGMRYVVITMKLVF